MLNCILLPLNGLRLFQMRKLIADVERAAASDQSSIDWLMPYMSGRISRRATSCSTRAMSPTPCITA